MLSLAQTQVTSCRIEQAECGRTLEEIRPRSKSQAEGPTTAQYPAGFSVDQVRLGLAKPSRLDRGVQPVKERAFDRGRQPLLFTGRALRACPGSRHKRIPCARATGTSLQMDA
jgi:hypothetical protein